MQKRRTNDRWRDQGNFLLDSVAFSTATLASERAELEAGVHGDHLGQNLQHLLGDGLVIYRDEVLGLGVHLQGLVEGQGGLDLVCT